MKSISALHTVFCRVPFALPIEAVSYTHLDVYKRQPKYFFKIRHAFPEGPLFQQQILPAPGSHHQTAVLQTHLQLRDFSPAGFVQSVGQYEDGRQLIGQQALLARQKARRSQRLMEIPASGDFRHQAGFLFVEPKQLSLIHI